MATRKSLGVAMLSLGARAGLYIPYAETGIVRKHSRLECLAKYKRTAVVRGRRKTTEGERQSDNRGTLADRIAEVNYLPFRANVPALNQAQLIIVGDLHEYGESRLERLVPSLVRRQDLILIEQSADAFPVMNFATAEGRAQWRSYEKSADAFLRQLAQEHRGTVVPIDAARAIKNEQIYHNVRDFTLRSACAHSSDGFNNLHPFEQWVLRDDLQLISAETTQGEIPNVIVRYMGDMPPYNDISEQRQRAIIENIVTQVQPVGAYQRAVLILGSWHVTRETPSLLAALEWRKIGYLAFVPDEIAVLREPHAPPLTDVERIRIGLLYLQDSLCDHYVQERIWEGVTPYRGTFTGMAERILKARGTACWPTPPASP